MTSREDELIQNDERPHKIVLDYGKGHREPMKVPETMTLAQLYEHASRRSSETTTAAAAAVVTLKNGVPRPRILEYSPHALVRASIPPQSRVLVEIAVAGDGMSSPPKAVEDMYSRNDEKQTKYSNSNNKIIDLSTETDSDDDRDLTPHLPPTKRAKRGIHADAGSSSSGSSDQNTADTDDMDDPTTVDHKPWIYQYGKSPYRDQKVLGKWLVFDSATKIAQTWQTIRQAVASATIPSAAAKVSTLWQQQNNSHNKTYVICVYCSVELMDDVAHALIPLVRRNISFKTDEATGLNRYAYNSGNNAKVTTKTLYWNRGRPTFTKNTAKLMTPVEALKLAVQTAAQYKKNNTAVSLDYSFDIIVTCSGIQHHIPDLEERRQLWTEGQGATELVLIRDPDNKFDPKYAIRVERLASDTNHTENDIRTGKGMSSAVPQQQNNHNNTSKPPPTVVGYIASTTPPYYARLLAPFLDRHLLSIDSAQCARWVNPECTV